MINQHSSTGNFIASLLNCNNYLVQQILPQQRFRATTLQRSNASAQQCFSATMFQRNNASVDQRYNISALQSLNTTTRLFQNILKPRHLTDKELIQGLHIVLLSSR
jgi:SRSO17 transposase